MGGVGRHGLAVDEVGFDEENPNVSVIESFRLGLGRVAVWGGDVCGGRGIAGGGKGNSGNEGSGYCTMSSLKGPQKYSA